MIRSPKISIIIPTYNEEKDILQTLKSIHDLDYDNFEVLIIDDSTDSTPDIINNYKSRKINYYRPNKRAGRCEARNIGVKRSKGEILIILNADVFLPRNFIKKIIKHYEDGADYVLVESEVRNINSMYARYVDCQHKYDRFIKQNSNAWMWTEGFSIKKESILKTSLFPSGYSVPIVAGEDARFGKELIDLKLKKKLDLNITVKHNAPSDFSEFWNIRKGRGQGTPQIRRFLDKWSFARIFFMEVLKISIRLLSLITLLPNLISSLMWSFHSNKKYRTLDSFRFFYCKVIEDFATSYGAFSMLKKIYILERVN